MSDSGNKTPSTSILFNLPLLNRIKVVKDLFIAKLDLLSNQLQSLERNDRNNVAILEATSRLLESQRNQQHLLDALLFQAENGAENDVSVLEATSGLLESQRNQQQAAEQLDSLLRQLQSEIQEILATFTSQNSSFSTSIVSNQETIEATLMPSGNDLTDKIIGCAMKVHNKMEPGFQEVTYKRCLAIELERAGVSFVREQEQTVYYEGIEVGTCCADFVVENQVVVELKAVVKLENAHLAQAKNHTLAYDLPLGLLINFGGKSLEYKLMFNNRQEKDF